MSNFIQKFFIQKISLKEFQKLKNDKFGFIVIFMVIVRKKTHFFMDVIQLLMVVSLVGQQFVYYQEFLLRKLIYLVSKIVDLKLSPIKLAQVVLLLGSNFLLHIHLLQKLVSLVMILGRMKLVSFLRKIITQSVQNFVIVYLNFIVFGSKFSVNLI